MREMGLSILAVVAIAALALGITYSVYEILTDSGCVNNACFTYDQDFFN